MRSHDLEKSKGGPARDDVGVKAIIVVLRRFNRRQAAPNMPNSRGRVEAGLCDLSSARFPGGDSHPMTKSAFGSSSDCFAILSRDLGKGGAEQARGGEQPLDAGEVWGGRTTLRCGMLSFKTTLRTRSAVT